MMAGTQIDEWKQAYDLLDVPPASSPESIKKAYRRLIKRWHPDRYRSGTPAYDEATQMTKQINEAYSQISSAPLRFGNPVASAAYPRSSSSPLVPSEEALRDLSPNLGRQIDFWTQFTVRVILTSIVLFGFFFHASMMLTGQPAWRFVIFFAINLACGFGLTKTIRKFQDTLRKRAVLAIVVLFLTLFSGLTLCAFINPEFVIIFIFQMIALGFATVSAALALNAWKTVQDYLANKDISSFSEF